MNQEEQADKSESNEGCQLVLELKEIWYIAIARNWVSLLACENSRPSLPAQVAFPSREMPLAPGAKKDGCFRRLGFCGKFQIMHHSRTEKVLGGGGWASGTVRKNRGLTDHGRQNFVFPTHENKKERYSF